MDPPRIIAVRLHQVATLRDPWPGVQPAPWELALVCAGLDVRGATGTEHRLICGGPGTIRGRDVQAATGVVIAPSEQPLAHLAAGAVLNLSFWLGVAGTPLGPMEHGYVPLWPLPVGLDETVVTVDGTGFAASRAPAADPRHLTWRGVAKPGFSVPSGEVLAGLVDRAGHDRSLRCPAGGPWQVAAVEAQSEQLAFRLLRLRYNGSGDSGDES